MTRSFTRLQTISITVVALGALGLAFLSFQAGRKSVDAAKVSLYAKGSRDSAKSMRAETPVDENHKITVRNIATVPFTELYDILRIATPEQLAGWARELEELPEGPGRTAAVKAFYRSLIQVNASAALEAVRRIRPRSLRDAAATALLEIVPESLWNDIAEFFETVPFPGDSWEDPIENWSRVDPVAVSRFIESHPRRRNKDEPDDQRVITLLWEWAQMDPAAAKEWLDADASRQTTHALSTWVQGLAEHDRAAAGNFLIGHADQQNFAEAIDDYTYRLFLDFRGDLTGFLFRLPPEQSHQAVWNIAHTTAALILGSGRDFQRPPAEVANWLVTLPAEYWSGAIGQVVGDWLMQEDSSTAVGWLQQMAPRERDIVLSDLCRVSDTQFGGRPTEIVSKIVLLGLTISDRQLRDESLAFALGHLAHKDDDRQAAIEHYLFPPKRKNTCVACHSVMTKSRAKIWALGAGLITLPALAFVAGQHVGRNQSGDGVSSVEPIDIPSISTVASHDYRQLPIDEILALPFSEFYEALGAAPAAARENWAAQIAGMPAGPRRTAAFRAFYKLLAQFDPAAAAEKVAAITDQDLQRFALQILVDAVPESAVPMIAELVLRLNVLEHYPRDSFSEICRKWAVLDPAALARFLDAHPREGNRDLYEILIGDWAALDPNAAVDWLSRTEIRRTSGHEEMPPPQVRVASNLIGGWFLHDRLGAAEFVIAHVDNPDFEDAVAEVAALFYTDQLQSEAEGYFERLPTDAARRLMFERLRETWTFDSDEEMHERHTDPSSVTQWITQFPPRYWQGTLGPRLQAWAKRDLDDMLDWLAQQTPAIGDAVAADFQVPNEAPLDDVARRIFNLADPNLRDRLLPAVFKNMSMEDAQKTILNSNVSPAQKQHLLDVVRDAEAASEGDSGK